MSLSAGSATSGKTGALAIQVDSTGSPLYLPHGGFNPTVSTGKAVVGLVNNTAFSSNEVQGVSVGQFDIACPLVAGLWTAGLYAALFGYVAGDADSANYHLLTNFPDDAGSAPVPYALCKFGTLSQRVTFSTDGLASAVGQRLSGMSLDPESGSVAALAAPSAGPISNSGVAGYEQTTITNGTNALDGLAQVDINVTVTLIVVPGKRAGTNAAYPYLAKGLLATNLTGTVAITQVRNPQYAINGDGVLVANFGATGAGVSESISLMPMGTTKPTGLGINYQTQRYQIKSVSGEQPISWTNL